MNSPDLCVRHFQRDDIPQLLTMMKELAAFEGYLDAFAVTQSDLEERGLCREPQFRALVAEKPNKPGDLLGMAVFHFIPYTYDLTPDLVLKELYVRESARGFGAGKALIEQVRIEAVAAGCKRIKWLVLASNDRAKAFYQSLGGRRDDQWELWSLDAC